MIRGVFGIFSAGRIEKNRDSQYNSFHIGEQTYFYFEQWLAKTNS